MTDAAEETAGPDIRLDHSLIDAVAAGRLDRQGEAQLAGQVARVLPFHWTLPNSTMVGLVRLRNHFGGEPGLLDWLDRYPGRPRLVARLYRLTGLLDELSTRPAVVEAVRELRDRVGDPTELTGYLVPDTDSSTLSSLGSRIESLLGEDRVDEAAEVALGSVALLLQAAPRADELDPDLGDLTGRMEQVRRRLADAVQEYRQHDRSGADPGESQTRVGPGVPPTLP
jgi:hypothetical protein